MTPLLLALDQGTSSTRCLALEAHPGLALRGEGAVPVACRFPAPGLVEQDPEELAASAVAAMAAALDAAGAGWDDVAGLAIANQTETFVVWERASGRALHPAIGWQDRRTAEACERLRAAGHEPLVRGRTGLELDATFPATKLRWLLEHVPGAEAAAAGGELAYGDVGSWLVHRLGGGREHATDAANAHRSLLCRLDALEWDAELLDLFGVPAALLPPIGDSDAVRGETDPAVAGGAAPIVAVLGDQQASLFGQACWAPGEAKVTLGTGGFLWVQAGAEPPAPPPGVLATCAWRRRGRTAYALEGFVPVAGAAVDWLVEVGVLPRPEALDALCRAARDDGVVAVPALQGLGTPAWRAAARGAYAGLSRATTRADLVRATVDGVLHQVADGVEAVGELDTLWVDGGLSRSAWIVQRLADLAGVGAAAARADSTALGAATLAGLAAAVGRAPRSAARDPTRPLRRPHWRRPNAKPRARWAEARELSSSRPGTSP